MDRIKALPARTPPILDGKNCLGDFLTHFRWLGLLFLGLFIRGSALGVQIQFAAPGGFETNFEFQDQIPFGPVRIPGGSFSVYISSKAQDGPGELKRYRYKMEGVDERWGHGGGFMRLQVVFFDANHSWVGQKEIAFTGESPGWTGTIEHSPFQDRQEEAVIPRNAATFVVVLTSAGPPTTVGTIVIGKLSVRRVGEQLPLQELNIPQEGDPAGWVRSGELPNMAHITRGGSNAQLTIIDESPDGHAEWRSPTLRVSPQGNGREDQLRINWSCCYSIGTTDWNGPIYYRNLEPGRYSFRFEEMSYSGQHRANDRYLGVIVLPPYWQRGWFLIASGLVTGLSVVALLRFRSWRRSRLEIARLREQTVVATERARIARDIHDDLGSALSGISMLSQFLDLENSTREEAIENLQRIHKATHKMSQAMDEIVWALNPRNDQVDRLVTFFSAYAQDYLSAAKVEFRCNYPENIPDWQVDAAKRHNLFLAFKEALANAVRHAQCRTVELEVEISEDKFTLAIADDGIGFSPSQGSGAGNGLVNMQQRLEALGGSFSLKSHPGKGTRIVLEVPKSN